jgi:hypothetical protein
VSTFQVALAELDERVKATVGMEPGAADKIANVRGNPDELVRKVLSGYVPVEDTDEVLEFLQGASKSIQQLVFNANSPLATDAGLRFTVAQMFVIGAAIERQSTEALRRVAKTLSVYWYELGVNDEYPEGQDLLTAMRDAGIKPHA